MKTIDWWNTNAISCDRPPEPRIKYFMKITSRRFIDVNTDASVVCPQRPYADTGHKRKCIVVDFVRTRFKGGRYRCGAAQYTILLLTRANFLTSLNIRVISYAGRDRESKCLKSFIL